MGNIKFDTGLIFLRLSGLQIKYAEYQNVTKYWDLKIRKYLI